MNDEELQKKINLFKQRVIGGAKEKKLGTRLSSLSDEDRKKYPTKQGLYTDEEIALKLKNFTKISIDELFEIPKGIYVRYFIDDNDEIKYRSGGFIIYKDEDQKYVTLISRHGTGNAYTWNMQIDTLHSVYAMTANLNAYKYKKIDNKFNLIPGTFSMLKKWFSIDSDMINGMKFNKNIIVIIYDKNDNTFYYPIRKETTTSKLNSLNISNSQFKNALNVGIINQLKEPINDKYIIGLIDKENIKAINKMKTRIKSKNK